ncbi:DNA invertase Pin-like site-specific DNA recombinase [Sinomonas sp. RB5]
MSDHSNRQVTSPGRDPLPRARGHHDCLKNLEVLRQGAPLRTAAAYPRRSAVECVSESRLAPIGVSGIRVKGFRGTMCTMRLLGYTRVSTAAQDAQLQRDALIGAGVEPRDIFADVTSGRQAASGRPGMVRLLEYATPGDVVVVWRVDRLGRSLLDVLTTVDELRERGISVRSIQDGMDPDTASGRLMLNMLATLAEYERELISERVSAGIAAARASGIRFGRPSSDHKVVTEKLAIVAAARGRGHTAAEAAALVGWSRATLYRHQKAQLARGAASGPTKSVSTPVTSHTEVSRRPRGKGGSTPIFAEEH